eukprot:1181073-Prorocentrum_minimum.AAC.6
MKSVVQKNIDIYNAGGVDVPTVLAAPTYQEFFRRLHGETLAPFSQSSREGVPISTRCPARACELAGRKSRRPLGGVSRLPVIYRRFADLVRVLSEIIDEMTKIDGTTLTGLRPRNSPPSFTRR